MNHNQVDPKPISLTQVSGDAKDERGIAIPGIKLLLFTDPGHKLIASAATDASGKFVIRAISRGRYRLVAKSVFCPANVPIRVGSGGGDYLHLHMVVGGIDACSYGSLK